MTTKRRTFSPEFKREAAELVLEQSYSYPQACEALGIGETALGPGYLIGQFFSTDEKGYWGYVWKGVWIAVSVLAGLAFLFYFAVQMVENPS